MTTIIISFHDDNGKNDGHDIDSNENHTFRSLRRAHVINDAHHQIQAAELGEGICCSVETFSAVEGEVLVARSRPFKLKGSGF